TRTGNPAASPLSRAAEQDNRPAGSSTNAGEPFGTAEARETKPVPYNEPASLSSRPPKPETGSASAAVRYPFRKSVRSWGSEIQAPPLTSIAQAEVVRNRAETPKQSTAQSEGGRIKFNHYTPKESERLQAQGHEDNGSRYAAGSIQPIANASPHYL